MIRKSACEKMLFYLLIYLKWSQMQCSKILHLMRKTVRDMQRANVKLHFILQASLMSVARTQKSSVKIWITSMTKWTPRIQFLTKYAPVNGFALTTNSTRQRRIYAFLGYRPLHFVSSSLLHISCIHFCNYLCT